MTSPELSPKEKQRRWEMYRTRVLQEDGVDTAAIDDRTVDPDMLSGKAGMLKFNVETYAYGYVDEAEEKKACNVYKPEYTERFGENWQRLTTEKDDILVHMAYVDGDKTMVTILALSRRSHTSKFCQLWYPFESRGLVQQAGTHLVGPKTNVLNGTTHLLHVYIVTKYSCFIPETSTAPTDVSLALDICGESTTLLPIRDEPNNTYLAYDWITLYKSAIQTLNQTNTWDVQFPVSKKHWCNIYTMLVQRRRRWADVV